MYLLTQKLIIPKKYGLCIPNKKKNNLTERFERKTD